MHFISIIFYLLTTSYFSPTATSTDFVNLLSDLPAEPSTIILTNDIQINNQGGHLQGIQPYHYQGEDYLIFSGSSSTYGYLAVANEQEVKKLHVLMEKPFKHAGGFQVHKNWLAVGIEDNEARTISEVHIYQLDDPMSDLPSPVSTIKRSGERERATSGCVAITELDNSLLVAVGDWDTRHIDFYRANLNQKELIFQKTGEIEMEKHPKSSWSDPLARPYQNINLFMFNGELYLVGFASDPSDVDIMDVFQLENHFSQTPKLTKLSSKKFNSSDNTRFGWGAGLSIDEEKSVSLYSCGRNIGDETVVSTFH